MKLKQITFNRYTAGDGRRMVQVHLDGQPMMSAQIADLAGEQCAVATAKQITHDLSRRNVPYRTSAYDGDNGSVCVLSEVA